MNLKDTVANLNNKEKIVIGGIAAIVLVCGWQLYKSITYEPPKVHYVPLVRTYTVEQNAAIGQNTYPGEVRGRYESDLAFQASGKINRRLVNVGDTVTAGQVLMTLDPKDIQQDVEAANAQLASAESAQKLAAANAERYTHLYQTGAASKLTLDQYVNELNAANASLREARANATASYNQLEYTSLVSDADGVVSSLSGEIGQVVSSGTVMATVVRKGEREIKIDVPENVLLKVGQKARVIFWALANTEAEGYVREISPMADSVSRTYEVAVAVPELPENAKLGMTAKVSFDTDIKDTLVIPAAAIYSVGGNRQVWVVRDKHVQLQPVKVTSYMGNDVCVASGLKPGDVVVTAGLSKLINGMEVRTNEGGE